MHIRRVLLFALGLFAVVAVTAQGEGVAQQASPTTSVERTEGAVVGASIAHPAGWTVQRERYTFGGTYGFTLWRPAGSQDHGGVPAVRVALAEKLRPPDIEDEVGQTLAYYQDQGLDVGRETVGVGAKGRQGVAFGPIPGSTPATRVYVPVDGRVYRVDVFSRAPGEEGLDADDRRLLRTLRFERPSEPIDSLGLPRANAPEALYPAHGEEISTLDRGRMPSLGDVESRSLQYSASSTGEKRLAEGCWQANPAFWVQTQHGPRANANKADGIPTGWTRIGVPNFWGQYTHGDLGYGRCNEPYYANDKYAIDYPMDRGDPIWSPFACGRVTFAGRNETHIDYGILVSIKSCNGKYFSLTSHFSALRRGLSKGDRVDKDTLLGYAGKSGGPRIPVGQVHFHQVFYRYPKLNRDGSPYGGQGLQVIRHHYIGTAARRKDVRARSHVYKYEKVRPNYGIYCRESRTCGEGYLISN
jgi:murein DD-endopeptidase MepM/ murein hydrolase activator NlpD